MNDTSPAVQEKLRSLMSQRNPAERLEMGCRLFDFSKAVVVSSIAAAHPGASPVQMRQETFRRFYANDFSPAQLKTILAWIARGVKSES